MPGDVESNLSKIWKLPSPPCNDKPPFHSLPGCDTLCRGKWRSIPPGRRRRAKMINYFWQVFIVLLPGWYKFSAASVKILTDGKFSIEFTFKGKASFLGRQINLARRASQCCQTTNLKRGIASGIRPCANHPSTGQPFVRHLVKKKVNKYKNRKAQQNTHTHRVFPSASPNHSS